MYCLQEAEQYLSNVTFKTKVVTNYIDYEDIENPLQTIHLSTEKIHIDSTKTNLINYTL